MGDFRRNGVANDDGGRKRQQNTESPRQYGQKQSFRKHLPNDAGPIGSDRHSDGDLLMSCRRTRQKKVCNVHTGDQQNESDSAK